ncbi:hypothetical protein L2E82_44726 [Cichorium intybus]|uniref:Uncharacterized protein n=1 Tax=Cichorium intybus TaxID=13427 RepID=A0ACB8ZQ55_CICIN|nr:hypothetical protein L2E82_44726 [Cichorium intybus]
MKRLSRLLLKILNSSPDFCRLAGWVPDLDSIVDSAAQDDLASILHVHHHRLALHPDIGTVAVVVVVVVIEVAVEVV